MGGVLFSLKRGFGLVAAAAGVLKATSAVGGWLWSEVPVWTIVLAVTFPSASVSRNWLTVPPRVPPVCTVVFTWPPVPGPRCADHAPPSGRRKRPQCPGDGSRHLLRGHLPPATF